MTRHDRSTGRPRLDAGLDADALHSRTDRFARMLERARVRIAQLPSRPVVAWSGGKDSTVAAELVTTAHPDTVVAHLDSGIEFPETVNYVRTLAAARGWNLQICHGDALEIMRSQGGWDHQAPHGDGVTTDAWYQPLTDLAHNLDGVLVWGLRADESNDRRWTIRRYGWRHTRVRDGITTAAPIWDWSDRDVYAAHAAFDLPLNPVYDRLRRLGAPRQAWRVDAAVSGARGLDQGRIEWLRRGWPDLYRRLEQALPRLKEF